MTPSFSAQWSQQNDRLGRDLRHLVNTVHDLTARGVGLKVLTGQGAAIDTTTPAGKRVFGIFAALSELERELISERTVAGLASARARGRKGVRPFKMSPAELRLAMAAMRQPETQVGRLCEELGVTRHSTGMFPRTGSCGRMGRSFYPEVAQCENCKRPKLPPSRVAPAAGRHALQTLAVALRIGRLRPEATAGILF